MRVKYFIIVIVLLVSLYVGYRFFVYQVFEGTSEKKHSKKDAIENYNKREKEIIELVEYFTSKVPDNKDVSFGLGGNDNQFDIGVSAANGIIDSNYPIIGGSNLELHSRKADSALSLLSWSDETVNVLKEKLEKSKCINIMSGNPIRIEYKYSGMGLYSYFIFNKRLADSTIKMYNRELGDTVIRDNVVVLFTSSL